MTQKAICLPLIVLVAAVSTSLIFTSCQKRRAEDPNPASSYTVASDISSEESSDPVLVSSEVSSAVSSLPPITNATVSKTKSIVVKRATVPSAPKIGVTITSPKSGTIRNTTSVVVSGIGNHIVNCPMWYEVYGGALSSKLSDFGAFTAASRWSFTAKNLINGKNIIVVYALLGDGKTTSDSVTLTYDDSGSPTVRPCTVPAEISWGGLGQNQQLTDNPNGWTFVRKYADIYFFHSAYWGGKDAQMKSLVSLLKASGTKCAVELGGRVGSTDTWPLDQYNLWGNGPNGWLNNIIKSTGVIFSESTYDFHDNSERFVTDNPGITAAGITAKMEEYWQEYFTHTRQTLPYLKEATTWQPVWWWWKNYPPLGGDSRNSLGFTVGGQKYNLNGYDILNALRSAVAAAFGSNKWTFYTDSPYYTLVYNPNKQDGAALLTKIIAYENWLHQNSCRHTFICNEDPGTRYGGDRWDQIYALDSLASLKLYQASGGRADTYNFESWYFDSSNNYMPAKVAPESAQYSYTWLVEQAIKYLKGINTNGSYEKLTLKKTTSGKNTVITLTNNGDVECMPVLRAFESGSSKISVRWFDGCFSNTTQQLLSQNGCVYTKLLKPGASISIVCQTSGSDKKHAKNISVEAYWNPQDPTGVVRDRVNWSVN